MTLLGILILTFLVLSVLTMPRHGALTFMIVGILFIGQGQWFEFMGIAVYPTRLLGGVCLLRAVFMGELQTVKWGVLDVVIGMLYTFIYVVHALSPHTRTIVLARSIEALVQYAAFRSLIRNPDDVRLIMRTLVLLLIPYVLLLTIESITMQNPFVVVGGNDMDWLREGKRRCFGSFRHPSTLGSLGAVLLPVYLGLFKDQVQRKRACVGVFLSCCIVIFANSGGPVSAALTGLAGWFTWIWRQRMPRFRLYLLIGLLGVVAFMKAPIWYLPFKLSLLTGGDGYHRSRLMDIAFQNIGNWWVYGMPIEATGNWFPYMLEATGGADITNQFVAFGISAGVGAVFLSFLLFVKLFAKLGDALQRLRTSQEQAAINNETLLWGLGVSMVVHMVNWIGITYFDQFSTFWFFGLASVGSIIQWSDETALVPTLPDQI